MLIFVRESHEKSRLSGGLGEVVFCKQDYSFEILSCFAYSYMLEVVLYPFIKTCFIPEAMARQENRPPVQQVAISPFSHSLPSPCPFHGDVAVKNHLAEREASLRGVV